MTTKSLKDETLSHLDETTAKDSLSTKNVANRRSFLKRSVLAGAAVTAGAAILEDIPSLFAERGNDHLTRGDVAILRFLAAAEIIETDIWLQYQELAGTQDNEVSTLAGRQISGYPSTPTGGNSPFTNAVSQLDGDMAQYIHDNTEDELSHENFINAFLVSKGAAPLSLDQFRTLQSSSKATGANQVPRLTDLRKLTVDTTWWTRYRSRNGNPDLGEKFPPAVPTLSVGAHPGIPRTDEDLNDPTFLQAIANTAGFHFANVEVGGSSLYPSLAQRVSSVDVLRILLSIGGTEIAHFQTWHDKAGNAVPLSAKDPVTGVHVTFPDLTKDSVGENLKSNLIMPEPTAFLSRKLPVCSIIRPTETEGAAMAALQGFVKMNIFAGQPKAFLNFFFELAEEADKARRGVS